MEEKQTGFFVWLQDNARILLSVALVLFLLFAVYSYSKRTDQSVSVVTGDGTVVSEDIDGDGDIDEDDALTADIKKMLNSTDKIVGENAKFDGQKKNAKAGAVSYTHLTLPTTPYV